MVRVGLGVPRVEERQFVQGAPLVLAALERLGVQVEQRRPFRAQPRPLVVGREEPVAPVAGAALRQGQFRHHHVARQVLILRAETVGQPRAERRVAAEAAARVHVEEGFRVIQRLGLTAPVIAQLVGHGGVGHVDPLIAHVQTRLAHLAGLERTADVELEAGLLPSRALRFRLVQCRELRLGVERVGLARPTFHEEHDARLGLRRVHRRLHGEGPGFRLRLGREQVAERDGAERGAEPVEERPAGRQRRRRPRAEWGLHDAVPRDQ